MWYNAPLYPLSDLGPPHDVVAATTDESGTALYCMASMTDAMSSVPFPEEFLQTLERWK